MIVSSFDGFDSASQAVLKYLHERLDFDLWMVTRTAGEDWVVLQSEDRSYGVEPGSVLRWADSFCSEMVRGNGPRIAPCSDEVPAYSKAAIGRQFPIKAYVGAPLTRDDGSLFGTLCAIDPSPRPPSIVQEQQLVELMAALLSSILQAELRSVVDARRSERLLVQVTTDSLCGALNRRGWNQILETEERRCQRYGHPAAILTLDLDGLKQLNDSEGHSAGDDLIVRTTRALRRVARSVDAVARLGGDEFALLCVDFDRGGAESLLSRARTEMANAQIDVSIGLAMRDPKLGLQEAWKRADMLMYKDKHSRKLKGVGRSLRSPA